MGNVSNIVKTIQDIMRKDAGTYGDAQRLEQLGWLFFLKIFDDREKELALVRDAYASPLPEPCAGATGRPDRGHDGRRAAVLREQRAAAALKTLRGRGDRVAGLIRAGLRRRQQLHEERHLAAAGDQQDQRHRLQRLG